MRIHFASDLHLEKADFDGPVPGGDVLVLAGDVCHARCLAPAPHDLYASRQRDCVLRLVDRFRRAFTHVVLVAGNHEHRDGCFEDTVAALRTGLDGITVLDDEAVEIGGVAIFGTTLWSDFEGRDPAAMDRLRKSVGDYFFVRRRPREGEEADTPDGPRTRRRLRLQPEDVLDAHDRALAAFKTHMAAYPDRRTIVVSHHAPSRKGLAPRRPSNGLDGGYASDLEDMIEGLANVPLWIHGHTHVRTSYQIGATKVVSNARGIGRDAAGFTLDRWCEV
ncbi:MAG: metallophosphoesterase [Hyphomicrobiaceae bacterium]